MYFNIPAIGTMFVISADMTFNNIENYQLQCLRAFKDCKQAIIYVKNAWGSGYERVTVEGTFTFPKGTIFKIENIRLHSPKAKEQNKHLLDCIDISIVETPLVYLADEEVIKTPTGRISKKKKDRPHVQFPIGLSSLQNISCEITV